MSREKRVEIIREIERKRGSKVIAYVTSDRQNLSVPIESDVISIIHNHILALGKTDDIKLDLFIYSRGGQSDVPWTIVSMFREYAKKGSFSVLIPYRAHSAATVISLGADEIIMTQKAELGPIDITIGSGPYNPIDKDSHKRLPISVEDVRGYFSLLEKIGCVEPEERMQGFELLTNNVHPLALGTVSRLLEETKVVGLRLLSTRAKPFSKSQNQKIIKALSSEVFSHGHTINRTEARRYIQLKHVKDAEAYNIDNELWELYKEYMDLFKLEEPYKPEEYLIVNDLENYTWDDLNLACVESIGRFDICRTNMRVIRLRKVPPQINLNLNNMTFPVISIPNIPAGFNQQQIEALIQQVVSTIIQQSLNNATQAVVQQLLRSLPQAGFERISYNSGWKKES